MFVSESFKKDIQSKNTNIVPMVIIEKVTRPEIVEQLSDGNINITQSLKMETIGFSTIETTMKEPEPTIDLPNDPLRLIHFKPLLIDLPKLKESIDIVTKKYKISSVTLKFYNNKIAGKRLSDIFTERSFINEVVSIHLKTQSCTTITPSLRRPLESNLDKTCLQVFQGKIRDIDHNDDIVTLKLEDTTESNLDKIVPAEYLGDTSDIPDRYKNKPIPMYYGRMKYAPTVGKYIDGKLTFLTDYKDIYDLVQEQYQSQHYADWIDTVWDNGVISVYENKYLPLLFKQKHIFVTNQFTDEEETELNPDWSASNIGDEQYGFNIFDQRVWLEPSGLFGVNRVQTLNHGFPEYVSLFRFDHYSDNNAMELFTEDHYLELTTNEEPNIFIEDVTQGNGYHQSVVGRMATFMWKWRLSFAAGEGNIGYTKLVGAKVNNYNLPVYGWEYINDTSYVTWYSSSGIYHCPYSYNNLFLQELNPERYGITDEIAYGNPPIDYIPESWQLNNLQEQQDAAGNDINSIFSMIPNHTNFPSSYTVFQSSDFNIVDSWNNVTYTYYDNRDIKFRCYTEVPPTQGGILAETLGDAIPIIRFNHGAYSADIDNSKTAVNTYNIDFISMFKSLSGIQPPLFGMQNSTEEAIFANIKDIKIAEIKDIENANNRDYYINVKGRTDDYILGLHQDINSPELQSDYLENPVDIIRHILIEELGIASDAIDEEEYEEAWQEHIQWRFAFAVNKKETSKKLLQDISFYMKSYPRIKNNGKFGFVTLKRVYSVQDWLDAMLVNDLDIIDFQYKLTPAKDVISKLNINYDYDYAEKNYLKTILPDDANSGNVDWGLEYDFNEYENDHMLKFNGIKDANDNFEIIDCPYTKDYWTANEIASHKFYNNTTQHLVLNIKLPIAYSEIEVGTIIKFQPDKLVNGVKAFGIDYTNPVIHGGVVRYPLFTVTGVQRGLDFITISCYQLHLQLGAWWNADNPYAPFLYNLHGFDWIVDPTLYADSELQSEHPYFPNAIFTDTTFEPADDSLSYLDFVPLEAIDVGEFLIGADSNFSIDGNSYSDSYTRTFYIQSFENLQELLNNQFTLTVEWQKFIGVENLPQLQDFNYLIPSKNDDDSGYGDITNGSAFNQVGGFVALELRLEFTNGGKSVIRLQNIAGTEFDADLFNQYETQIPQTITPSTTELKLGWVMWLCNADWTVYEVNGYFLNNFFDTNPIIKVIGNQEQHNNFYKNMEPYVPNVLPDQFGFGTTYTMRLYPYFTPAQHTDITLQYNSNLDLALAPPAASFATPQDYTILNVVELVDMIMQNNYETNLDINNDGELDIFDVITLVDLIMG